MLSRGSSSRSGSFSSFSLTEMKDSLVFDLCQNKLAAHANATVRCFEHLYGSHPDLSPAVACNLYHIADICLAHEVIKADADCTPTQTQEFLPILAQAAYLALRVDNCCSERMYESPLISQGDMCQDPPENICDVTNADNKAALEIIIEKACHQEAVDMKEFLKEISSHQSGHQLSPETLICLGLQPQKDCALNRTLGLGLDCVSSDITGLFTQEDLLGQAIDHCQSGCYDESEEYRKCFDYNIINKLVDPYSSTHSARCRIYHYVSTCGKARLNDSCSEEEKETRVNYTIIQRTQPYYLGMSDWHNCTVPDVSPSICSMPGDLAILGGAVCQSELHNLYADCMNLESAKQCFGKLLTMYGDCDQGVDTDRLIETAIARSMRNDPYTFVQDISHCFTAAPRDGYCPVYRAMRNYNCPSVSSSQHLFNCTFDDECSGNMKCCDEGCQTYTCQTPATQPVIVLLTLTAKQDSYTPELDKNDSTEAERLKDKYEPLVQQLAAILGGVNASIDRFQESYNSLLWVKVKMFTFVKVTQSTIWDAISMNFETAFSLEYFEVFPPPGTADKDGECPRVILRPNYDYCRYDVDCPGAEKCCSGYYGDQCVEPARDDLADCQEWTTYQSFLPNCDINLLGLDSASCGDLLPGVKCMLDKANAERPAFYECTLNDVVNATKAFLESLTDVSQFMDLFNCRGFILELSLYTTDYSCGNANQTVGQTADEIMSNVFVHPSDYALLPGSPTCSGGTYKFNFTASSADSYEELYVSLSNNVYEHPNISGSFDLQAINMDIDRCQDLKTIKTVVQEGQCLKRINSSMNTDICSIVNELTGCLENEITSATNYKQYCYGRIGVFKDPETRAEIVEVIRDADYPALAEAVSRYSSRECVVDSYLCSSYYYYRNLLQSSVCMDELSALGNMSGGDICQYGFENLVECVTEKFPEYHDGHFCRRDTVNYMLLETWRTLQIVDRLVPSHFNPKDCNRTLIYSVTMAFTSLIFDPEYMNDINHPSTVTFINSNIRPKLLELLAERDFQIKALRNGSVLTDLNVMGRIDFEEELRMKIQDFPSIELQALSVVNESDLVCFEANFNYSFSDICKESWEAYNRTEDCRHLQMFLLCMKYNAQNRNQRCELAELYPKIKRFVTQKGMNDSEAMNMSMELCPCRTKFSSDLGSLLLETNSTRENVTVKILVHSTQNNQLIGFSISETQAMGDLYILLRAVGMQRMTVGRYRYQGSTLVAVESSMDVKVRVYRENYYSVFTFELKKNRSDAQSVPVPFTGTKFLHLFSAEVTATGDISVGTYETSGPEELSCETSDEVLLNELNTAFPTSAAEMCSYWGAHRYFLEYHCYEYVDSMDQDEMCLMQPIAEGCVLDKFQETGYEECTIDTVSAQFEDSQVTGGLLDLASGCGPYTECQNTVLYTFTKALESCYGGVGSLGILDLFQDVRTTRNADNTSSLACSTSKDTIRCASGFLNRDMCNLTIDANRMEVLITMSDLAVMTQKLVNDEYHRLSEEMSLLNGDTRPEIVEPASLEDCDIPDSVFEPRTDQCPSLRFFADSVVGRCAINIRMASLFSGNEDICSYASTLLDMCVKEVWPTLGFDQCDRDPREMSDMASSEHSDFVEEILGFDLAYCRFMSDCRAGSLSRYHCLSNIYTASTYFHAMTLDEVCGSVEFVKMTSKMCLQNDGLSADCFNGNILDTILEEYLSYIHTDNKTLGYIGKCKSYTPDECNMYGAVTVVHCLTKGYYDACSMLDCFTTKPAPESCNFNDALEEVISASERIQSFRPNCSDNRTFVVEGTIAGAEFIDAYYSRYSNETLELIEQYKSTFANIFGDFKFERFYKSSLGFVVSVRARHSDIQTIQSRAQASTDISIKRIQADLEREADRISPCDEQYFQEAMYDDCNQEWNNLYYYNDTDCSNYEAFIGCIVVNARSVGDMCDISVVHGYVQEKAAATYGVTAGLCDCESSVGGACDRLDELREILPATREAICTNQALFEHLLEVHCHFPNADETDMDSLVCKRKTLSAQRCVHPILRGLADCTGQHIHNLLTSQCAEDDLLLPCEADLYPTIEYHQCLNVLIEAENLPMINHAVNMTTLLSSNGEDTLRCRMLSDQVKCIIATSFSDGDSRYNLTRAGCDATNIANVIRLSVNGRLGTTAIYDQCKAVSPGLTVNLGCPTEDYLVDGITAYCGYKTYSSMSNRCLSLFQCFSESEEGIKYLYGPYCDEDDLNTGFEQLYVSSAFHDYFMQVTSLDVGNCSSDDQCYVRLLGYAQGGCLDTVYKTESLSMIPSLSLDNLTSSDSTSTLRCRILSEQIRCVVKTTDVMNVMDNVCNLTSLVEVIKTTVANGDGRYSECYVDIPSLMASYTGCPGLDYFTDVTTGYCGYGIYSADEGDKCRMARECFGTVQFGVSILYGSTCNDTWGITSGYMNTSSFKEYFHQVTGFDKGSCTGADRDKPGMCPPAQGNSSDTCQEECSDDSMCNGTAKCCFDGCGHTCQEPMPDSIDGYQCWDYDYYLKLLVSNACEDELTALSTMSQADRCRYGFENLVQCVTDKFPEYHTGIHCSRRRVQDMLEEEWRRFNTDLNAATSYTDPRDCHRIFIYELFLSLTDLTFDPTFMNNMTSTATLEFIRNNIQPRLDELMSGNDYEIVSLHQGSVVTELNVEGNVYFEEELQMRVENSTSITVQSLSRLEESDLVCFVPSFNRSFNDTCQESWKAYNRSGDCWHLEMFLLCMKYNAQTRNQRCELKELYPKVKQYIRNAGRNRLVAQNLSMELCPCRAEFMSPVGKLILETNNTRENVTVKIIHDMELDNRTLAFGISDSMGADVYVLHRPLDGMGPVFIGRYQHQGSSSLVEMEQHMDIKVFMYKEHYYNVFTFKMRKETPGRISFTGTRQLWMFTVNVSTTEVTIDGEYSSEEQNLTCETSDATLLDELNAGFPRLGAEMCSYWRAHRYFLEYQCYTYIDNLDQDEMCLMRPVAEGCVLDKFQETGYEECTIDTVSVQLQDSQVTGGLLDMEIGCESYSSCKNQVLYVYSKSLDRCYLGPGSLGILNIFQDVRETQNSDNTSSLACSMIKDGIRCAAAFIDGDLCNLTNPDNRMDVLYTMSELTVITQKYYNEAYLTALRPMGLLIDQEAETVEPATLPNCEIPDNIFETSTDVCPSSRFFADYIMGRCAVTVHVTRLLLRNNDTCSYALNDLDDCVKEVWPDLGFDECDRGPIELTDTAIMEYTDFVAEMIQSDPISCRRLSDCRAEINTKSHCMSSLYSVYGYFNNMNLDELCVSLDYIRMTSKMCLRREGLAADCMDDNILNMVFGEYIDYQPMGNSSQNPVEDCEGYTSNQCRAYGAATYVACISEGHYDDCSLMDCFTNKPAPENCGFNNTLEEAVSAAARLRYWRPHCYDTRTFEVQGTIANGVFVDALYNSEGPEAEAVKMEYQSDVNETFGPTFEFVRFFDGSLGFVGKFDAMFEELPAVERRAQESQTFTVNSIHVDLKGETTRISPCDERYFDEAVYDSCYREWNRLESNSQDCWNYESFLGCIMTNARSMGDERCDVAIVHSYASEKALNHSVQVSLCDCDGSDDPCDRLAELTAMLPTTRDGICTNQAIFSHLLSLHCEYPMEATGNDLLGCKKKSLLALDCVYPILYDLADCTREQTVAFIRPECGASEDVLDCERTLYSSIKYHPCIAVLNEAEKLHEIKPLNNMTTLMSSGNETTLRCRLLSEQVKCFIATSYTDEDAKARLSRSGCDATNIATVMKLTINIQHKAQGIYDECPAESASLTVDLGCPTQNYLTDEITAYCGHRVFSDTNKCSALQTCMTEAESGIAVLYEPFCEYRDLQSSFETLHMGTAFDSYFMQVTDFNTDECTYDDNVCLEEFSHFTLHGCLTVLYSIERLSMIESLDLDNLMSSNNATTLRCRVFSEQVKCMFNAADVRENLSDECNATLLVDFVRRALKTNAMLNVTYNSEGYAECEVDISSSMEPYTGCPSLDFYTDGAAGYCGFKVYITDESEKCGVSKDCFDLAQQGMLYSYNNTCGSYFDLTSGYMNSTDFKQYFHRVSGLDLDSCMMPGDGTTEQP